MVRFQQWTRQCACFYMTHCQVYMWLKQKKICLQCRRPGFDLWLRKSPWRREWLPNLAFLPGEFHGQRSLAGCSPWGCKELDTTEWLILTSWISVLLQSLLITLEDPWLVLSQSSKRGLPWRFSGEESACEHWRHSLDPWVRMRWLDQHHWLKGHESEQTHVCALCMGDSRGQRSLAYYSPWGHKESDTT